ncbi:Beta-xylosidase [Duganella sp. CF402]|uniref:glycoside hydrolase family 43 protein n=1 Tax=unclassified Duganella TaxID=2636909 RepID=UPI0008BBD855|nr:MULTISPECIES: glycoside hydrolase 43 family protein [unclassified Duganella]RZT10640.1 beta-xylosidase [Duganella sp. BK701]SEL04651.1 Beta-xylosidase [Duganella sp. CF402]
MKKAALLLLAAALLAGAAHAQPARTWTPDNGNGTFTNPLFYDEFSDPDIIRVNEWFYLTGTTMHAMPGLPVLRSRDLVNWEFLSYAADRLDFGPAYHLEGGKNIYGQGIWAPSLRYRNGVFYIFTNVNGRGTQIYSAINPRGPWVHWEMKRSLHDLSVLFDDDNKAYAVWGHQDMHIAQLTDDLLDIVPSTEKILFAKTDGMGEGAHFYKIGGKYYILSSNYAGGFRMPAARADNVYGPYEVNQAISKDEGFGLVRGYRLNNKQYPFEVSPPNPASRDATAMHQGGIVLTEAGEWWGFSMMDYNSVGRLTSLAPVTWKDGWPYFGLPGNPGRNPRTWVKPRVAERQQIKTPFERNDDFSETALKPVWQWNHVPVEDRWSLSERPGFLRLRSMPAASFWEARNTLTQRAIGPMSSPTVALDAAGLLENDVAGLALLNLPYATLGVERKGGKLALALFDQARNQTVRVPITATRLWLRAECDFMTEKARFSYSTDGENFQPIGQEFTMIFQLTTFQGVRYALFNYNTGEQNGGAADFDSITVDQPYPHGLRRPIPYEQTIQLRAAVGRAATQPLTFTVRDVGLGRVALQAGGGFLSIGADGGAAVQAVRPGLAQSFQWMETPTGELLLMSLQTNFYLRIHPQTGALIADSPGPIPDGSDGVRFNWSEVKAQ